MVQVYTVDGEPEIILVHIEVESVRRGTFPARMWEYYCLPRLRYRVPVLPVVVYLSPGAGGLVRERYTESLFGEEVLNFQYRAAGLPDLRAEDYEAQTNPLGPAFSALMRSRESRRVRRWLRILQQAARLNLNPAQQALLINVVEANLPLSPEESAELRTAVGEPGMEEVGQMETIFERWGREEGRKEGVIMAKHTILLRLMRLRFGALPEGTEARIEAVMDEAVLDGVTDRVLTAATLDELLAGLP